MINPPQLNTPLQLGTPPQLDTPLQLVMQLQLVNHVRQDGLGLKVGIVSEYFLPSKELAGILFPKVSEKMGVYNLNWCF